MRHASGNPGAKTVCNPTSVGRGEAVHDFLRAKHPFKTAECVAADIARATKGLPLREAKADSIDKMLERKSKPSFDLTMALIGTYGPEFVAIAYPGALEWVDAGIRQREIEAIRRQQEVLNARLEALV